MPIICLITADPNTIESTFQALQQYDIRHIKSLTIDKTPHQVHAIAPQLILIDENIAPLTTITACLDTLKQQNPDSHICMLVANNNEHPEEKDIVRFDHYIKNGANGCVSNPGKDYKYAATAALTLTAVASSTAGGMIGNYIGPPLAAKVAEKIASGAYTIISLHPSNLILRMLIGLSGGVGRTVFAVDWAIWAYSKSRIPSIILGGATGLLVLAVPYFIYNICNYLYSKYQDYYADKSPELTNYIRNNINLITDSSQLLGYDNELESDWILLESTMIKDLDSLSEKLENTDIKFLQFSNRCIAPKPAPISLTIDYQTVDIDDEKIATSSSASMAK